MKSLKKILAVVMVLTMIVALGATAYAAPAATTPSTPSITITATSENAQAQTDTTVYTWYRILDAEIEEDPTNSDAVQSGGKVSYSVDSQAKATALEGTGLFTVTPDASGSKWYVELTDDSTSGQAIADAFAANSFNLSLFPTDTFHQKAVGGTATTGEVEPGYYYITSTAGTKAVVQTLKAVTIEEKNTFPPVEKTVDETDKHAQLGDEIQYTLTVEVPATANDKIVLTDTMTNGLTFKSIDECKNGTDDVTYTLNPTAPAATDKTFTITFAAADVIANQGKTITIKYTAILNNAAVVGTPEKNKVVLDYGNNYTSKPSEVETETHKFTFDKIDGSNSTNKLPGAVFELQLNGTALPLVEVAAGETYRIATSEDTTTVTSITTAGKVITINGVDSDVTYQLVETKAPTGYNLPEDPSTDVKPETDNSLAITIENNKGAVLPSTGGIGTTIFYVVGGLMVAGAGVILVTRRRMNAEK